MNDKKSCSKRLINGLFVLLLLALIAAVLFPLFAQSKNGHPRSVCLINVKQMALGQTEYAMDYDDRLPQANVWMDAINRYVKDETAFHCPEAKATDPKAYGYSMNLTCSALNIILEPDPANLVLHFESVLLVRNAYSGFYGLPVPPRDGRTNKVAFVDGHAWSLTPEREAAYGPDGRKKR